MFSFRNGMMRQSTSKRSGELSAWFGLNLLRKRLPNWTINGIATGCIPPLQVHKSCDLSKPCLKTSRSGFWALSIYTQLHNWDAPIATLIREFNKKRKFCISRVKDWHIKKFDDSATSRKPPWRLTWGNTALSIAMEYSEILKSFT